MCKILRKKYSDLTVGEILGWSFGVGAVTLLIELISLKGINQVTEDCKAVAASTKTRAQDYLEQADKSFRVLKAKLHK